MSENKNITAIIINGIRFDIKPCWSQLGLSEGQLLAILSRDEYTPRLDSRPDSSTATYVDPLKEEPVAFHAGQCAIYPDSTAEGSVGLSLVKEVVTNDDGTVGVAWVHLTGVETALGVESERAKDAEDKLRADLSAEISRAKAAEQDISDIVDSEIVRSTNAHEKLAADITEEISRAKSQESAISGNLNTETTRAKEAEGTLSDSIAAETSRATQKESSLESAIAVINGEASTAGSISNSLKQAKDYTDSEVGKAKTAASTELADTIKSYATKTEVDNRIKGVVGAAPAALDTLEEIAQKLSDNDDAVSSIVTTLGNKSDKTHTHSNSTQSAAGFMSADDKKKLDGIAAGANAYTHPSTHEATIITQDSTHRFVSDTEKSTWNGKADAGHTHAAATQSANGFMSADDKKKLDGVTAGANAYTHPDSHSATMITQDATHRFVSDTEKSTWNSKAAGDHTHSQYLTAHQSLTNYTTLDGTQSITGSKTFTSPVVVSTTAMPLAAGKVTGLAAGTSRLYKDGLAISNPATANDLGWIRCLGTGESDTVLEIATGDDGGTGETIVFRGYNTSNAIAYSVEVPKKSGTVALTSDIPAIPTSLKNPNAVTFSAGTFSAQTYDGSAAKTVNVPTHTSHLTNNSGFLTAHQALDHINSLGRVTAVTDKSNISSGISMVEVYSNGYPCTYGNVIRAKGSTASGTGELLLGWSGTSGAVERVYYRNNRDSVTTFSEWRALAFTTDIPTSMAWGSITSKPTTLSGYGITDGITTATAASTYIPLSAKYNVTTKGALGWSDTSTDAARVLTSNTLAYWNGAYSGTSSNLAYCNQGAFGSMATKNASDYLPLSGGTMSNTNLVTNLNADLLDGVHNGDVTARYISYTNSSITSSSNDTTANWAGKPFLQWYSTTGQLTDQPSQYGLMLNITKGTEVSQLWFTKAGGNLYHRGGNASGWAHSWRAIIDSANIGSYNAGSATKLQTARTLTIGSTGKTFDGSGNVAWSLAEIGAAAASHTHSYAPLGSSKLTAVTSVPVANALYVAEISSSQSFKLASTPEAGREVHVIIKNTGSADIVVTLPTSGGYWSADDSITVKSGGYGEINAISDGTTVYLRSA